jgi:hypothetical protein
MYRGRPVCTKEGECQGVKQVSGSGVETPTNLIAGLILGYLEGVNKAFLLVTCVSDRRAISEHREDASMEYLLPIGEI